MISIGLRERIKTKALGLTITPKEECFQKNKNSISKGKLKFSLQALNQIGTFSIILFLKSIVSLTVNVMTFKGTQAQEDTNYLCFQDR